MTPLNTSRPSASVPMGNALDGGASDGPSTADGSVGASSGASAPIDSTTRAVTAPATPGVRDVRRRQPATAEPGASGRVSQLAEANTGIQLDVEKIGEQVGDDHCDGDDEEHPHDDGDIARLHGRDE